MSTATKPTRYYGLIIGLPNNRRILQNKEGAPWLFGSIYEARATAPCVDAPLPEVVEVKLKVIPSGVPRR